MVFENFQLWCRDLLKLCSGERPRFVAGFFLVEVFHGFQLECEYTEVVFHCMMSLSVLTPFR